MVCNCLFVDSVWVVGFVVCCVCVLLCVFCVVVSRFFDGGFVGVVLLIHLHVLGRGVFFFVLRVFGLLFLSCVVCVCVCVLVCVCVCCVCDWLLLYVAWCGHVLCSIVYMLLCVVCLFVVCACVCFCLCVVVRVYVSLL